MNYYVLSASFETKDNQRIDIPPVHNRRIIVQMI